MLSSKSLLVALTVLAVSAFANPIPAPATGCADVHVITARGSNEQPGEGIIGAVVDGVVTGSSQTVSREAVVYPATLTNYLNSEAQGVTAMKLRLADKTSSCPNTKIVLTGYSQGAHITGDVLSAGASGTANVVAAILMGDPGHVHGESFQKGTANNLDGLFPRPSGALEGFAAQLNSFCDIGDPFCAGGFSLPVHLATEVDPIAHKTRSNDRKAALFAHMTFFTLSVSVSICLAATPWPFDLTTLSAPDGSITAKFVSFGATLTELWVNDKNGKLRDVVLGYDDNTIPFSTPSYANRLKNGTFSIPITKLPQPDGPNVYHIPTNDHDGQVTLHGGIYGWDRRNWTLVSRTPTSVTYKHIDAADEGFPGTVTAYATHTVTNGGVLNTVVRATATEKTPIMLTQHIYWNLDAFQDGSNDILSHHLQVDASRVIDVDGNAIPTGDFISVGGTPFDFRQEQKIGARWNDTFNLCGLGCQGYDSAWIYDRPENYRTGTSLWSDLSGIRVDISTNQPAVQVYSSFWLNTPRKATHGGPSLNYGRWSAVAIEQEGHIDAINTPEWNVDQI
ncbi:hypothetical protein D9615_004827 [Tricholomella constricta]|uniref:Uncharacterized protein n=1 Tax=Tricholomella constricta TaxID=117010 RepID=A0A8H5HGR1_9AGAR|nr:hypothetical protein D9615_004827 [Tricholomella constricta]